MPGVVFALKSVAGFPEHLKQIRAPKHSEKPIDYCMRVILLSFPGHLWQEIHDLLMYLLPKPNKDMPLVQHLLSLHLLLTGIIF